MVQSKCTSCTPVSRSRSRMLPLPPHHCHRCQPFAVIRAVSGANCYCKIFSSGPIYHSPITPSLSSLFLHISPSLHSLCFPISLSLSHSTLSFLYLFALPFLSLPSLPLRSLLSLPPVSPSSLPPFCPSPSLNPITRCINRLSPCAAIPLSPSLNLFSSVGDLSTMMHGDVDLVTTTHPAYCMVAPTASTPSSGLSLYSSIYPPISLTLPFALSLPLSLYSSTYPPISLTLPFSLSLPPSLPPSLPLSLFVLLNLFARLFLFLSLTLPLTSISMAPLISPYPSVQSSDANLTPIIQFLSPSPSPSLDLTLSLRSVQ